MYTIENNIHKYKYSCHSQTDKNFLIKLANVFYLVHDKTNDACLLLFAVEFLSSNPNILSYLIRQ